MAELACLASIVQLADVGARVALTLFTIADNVRNAAVDARLIATDLSLFAASLRSLGKNLNKRLQSDEALQRMTGCLLKSCQIVVTELSSLVSGCNPDTNQQGKLFAGFKWTWKQSRIAFLRSSLESLKSTILLLIASVDLTDGPDLDFSETSPLQVQIVNMMKISESATADLVGKAFQQARSEQNPADESDSLVSLALIKSNEARFADTNDLQTLSRLTQTAITSDSPDAQFGRLALRGTSALIPLGPASIDLQAQQLVYQFAGNVLVSESRFKDEPAETSVPCQDVEKPATSSSEYTHTDSTSESIQSKPASTPEKRRSSDSAYASQGDTESVSNASQASESKLRNGAGGDEILQRLSELLLNRDSQARPEPPVPEQPKDELLEPPIRFKDAVGRKFTFPWHLVRTWKGMEALIQQAFLHVDVIGQHVHEGRYDLIGPNGEIILPQVWETMIKPDTLIEMKMWPIQEKKPPLLDFPLPPPPLIWSSQRASATQLGKPARKTRSKQSASGLSMLWTGGSSQPRQQAIQSGANQGSMETLFLASFLVLGRVAPQLLQVTTSHGTIRGAQCVTSSASQFLGIPYAQPPVGELRWAAPQPFGAYNGTFHATTASVNCIQFGTAFVESGPSSEDCLFLDVWVPPNANTSSKLPVKVWIYGGSGTAGSISDPLYNGCNLASDSIVVSINYRLGPLGWLALRSAGIEGNYGIQDLLLGLQWVQTNIAAFGGDPTKVLVFGQSEGAQLAWIISTLPIAPSLMNAVVAESGAGREYPLSNSTAVQSLAMNFASSLNCSNTNVTCLRNVSPSALNSSTPALVGASGDNPANVFTFNPLVDGKLVSVQPIEAGNEVPAILGTTTMEGTLFTLAGYKDNFPPSAQDYYEFLTNNFGYFASEINSTYSLSLFNSTPLPAFYAISQVITDYGFTCPTYRALLKSNEKNISAWTYLWSHVPTCDWYFAIPNNATLLKALNATHTSEIPFVFSNLDNLPLPNGTCNLTSDERAISAQFVSSWSSMAESRNPNAGGSITWPTFGNSSQGLLVGNLSAIVGNVDYSVCTEFWDKIDDAIFANSSTLNALLPNGTSPTSIAPSPTSSTGHTSSTGSTSSGAGNSKFGTGLIPLVAVLITSSIMMC